MKHLENIPTDVTNMMQESGLSSAEFERLRGTLRQRHGTADHNRIEGEVRIPAPGDLGILPDCEARAALHSEGLASIQRGEVGLVVLNGGMATRFGGVVKGTVNVSAEYSFLGLKILDALRVARAAGGEPFPILFMNSRATSQDTQNHLEANNWFGYPPDKIWHFEQCWSARLTLSGNLYLDSNGRPSFHGPGHGDLPHCLRRSGLLDRFSGQGGLTLLMSNVDNAVATMDPAILGWHNRRSEPITAEMAPQIAQDKGGIPLWVDDHLQIVEAFRVPPSVTSDTVGVLNTNTLWMDIEVLAAERALDWFTVKKRVGDHDVIQFERLIGQLTAFFPTAFLRIPRKGADTRFVPIKTPHDLEANAASLLHSWQSRVVL